MGGGGDIIYPSARLMTDPDSLGYAPEPPKPELILFSWQIHADGLENSVLWDKFCRLQKKEKRKELDILKKKRLYQVYRYCEKFAVVLARNRLMRKAMESEDHNCAWRVDHNRIREQIKNLRWELASTGKPTWEETTRAVKAMEEIQEKHRLYDAFLSKRVTERYRELAALQHTKATFYTRYSGESRFTHKLHKRVSGATESVIALLHEQRKWHRICEVWKSSSGSLSESKSATKKSTASARPTHVNECGI
jgi:hypothetical protein